MVVENVTEYLKVLQKKESAKDFVVDVLVKAMHETNRLAGDIIDEARIVIDVDCEKVNLGKALQMLRELADDRVLGSVEVAWKDDCVKPSLATLTVKVCKMSELRRILECVNDAMYAMKYKGDISMVEGVSQTFNQHQILKRSTKQFCEEMGLGTFEKYDGQIWLYIGPEAEKNADAVLDIEESIGNGYYSEKVKEPLTEKEQVLVDVVSKSIETMGEEKSRLSVLESFRDYCDTVTCKIAGGLNGCGRWEEYFSDISELVAMVRSKGVNMWLVEGYNDCLDDLFYLKFGLKNNDR